MPLSLARLPESAAYAVFEIGMNHAGEITPLTKLVRPHIAIITTVEPVHLEFFESVEAIADAKAEIFLGVEPGGAAVLNRDNPHFERLKSHAERAGVSRIVSFGTAKDCDARLIKLALQPESSTVEADILGERVTYKLGAPGPPSGDEFARGARRRQACRRGSCAGGARVRRSCRPPPAAARASRSTCRAARPP